MVCLYVTEDDGLRWTSTGKAKRHQWEWLESGVPLVERRMTTTAVAAWSLCRLPGCKPGGKVFRDFAPHPGVSATVTCALMLANNLQDCAGKDNDLTWPTGGRDVLQMHEKRSKVGLQLSHICACEHDPRWRSTDSLGHYAI